MRKNGFTLIELMITIAILAIIVAVALPSYQEHVAKTRRGEAMSALLEGVQALERYYSANGTYLNEDGDGLAAVFPSQVPASGPAYYTLEEEGALTRSTYVLRAERAGVMASDDCGDFEINHAGVRTLHGKASSKPEDQCWRR